MKTDKNNLNLPSFIPQSREEALNIIFTIRKAINGDKISAEKVNSALDLFQNMFTIMSEKNSKRLFSGELINDWDDDTEYSEDDYDYYESLYDTATLSRTEVKEYHLRIQLSGIDIPIWREIKVPSNVTLDFLIHLLLDLMGWADEHLAQFIHKKKYYLDEESVEENLGENMFNMSLFTLSDLLTRKGDKMVLEYDFGDSWRHDISLMTIRNYEKDEEHLVSFVNGSGDCPPEDCGGVGGYEELLSILTKKRKTQEDKERLEWYGIDKNYNPNQYNLEWGETDAAFWNTLLHR